MREVTLIPGDGIGPEVAAICKDAAARLKVDIRFDEQPAGLPAERAGQGRLPEKVLESIRRTKLAFKGPLAADGASKKPSPNVELRKALNLFANIRPIRLLPGIQGPFSKVDFVVIRENTEDIYSGIEHEVSEGVVETVKIVTENASRRVAAFAFDWARRHDRRKVTAIHKANIMKMSDGLFLSCAKEEAAKNTDIEFSDLIVDAAAMNLVRRPQQFDVVLCGNLYGDLLSDLGAGLVGGAGVCFGINRGPDTIVYEVFHGAQEELAGKRTFNPIAALLASGRLFRQAGSPEACARLETAVSLVTAEKKVRTADLGGNDSTDKFLEAVYAKL
ncbi:MAG: isocitrate/isopropylmalate family dehydrogenase [Bdellovibrionota bacterium]